MKNDRLLISKFIWLFAYVVAIDFIIKNITNLFSLAIFFILISIILFIGLNFIEEW